MGGCEPAPLENQNEIGEKFRMGPWRKRKTMEF